MDNFDSNKLKEDLRKIGWVNEILKNSNDINEIFDTFYKTLCEIVDLHAPLTKVAKKERTLQSKPWVNKEIKHLTVEPQFFELPRDRQSSSKNRGFEKSKYSLTLIFQTPTK